MADLADLADGQDLSLADFTAAVELLLASQIIPVAVS